MGVVRTNFTIEHCPLYSGTPRQGSKISRIAAVSANDSHLHITCAIALAMFVLSDEEASSQ